MKEIFPENYSEAREKFRNLAQKRGLIVESRSIAELGAAGEELFIDFAYHDHSDSQKLFLHFSGVHGVESFIGSAIQCAILEESLQDLTSSIVFIHSLNPYGMSHLRRTNGQNVDLNRNFRDQGEIFSNPDYGYFDRFLNPKKYLGLFYGVICGYINYLRVGKVRAQQAVPQGQYEFPQGLFFGGFTIQKEIQILQKFLQTKFPRVNEIFAIDVHSGLGKYQDELLFLESNTFEKEWSTEIENIFQRPINILDPDTGTYVPSGTVANVIFSAYPKAKINYITQEFGTYAQHKVLRSLRHENFQRHHGKNKKALEKKKRCLKNTFYPKDEAWRKNALMLGQKRFLQAWFQTSTKQ